MGYVIESPVDCGLGGRRGVWKGKDLRVVTGREGIRGKCLVVVSMIYVPSNHFVAREAPNRESIEVLVEYRSSSKRKDALWPTPFTTLPLRRTKTTPNSKMLTVALAGATTGLGLTILRRLTSSSTNTHKIVLLSRSPQPTWTARGVLVHEVDYESHETLTVALQGVHTVLSLIGGSATALRDGQLALVAAAKQAGVKRFAPSEFSLRGGGYDLDLYAGKSAVWDTVVASGMEYTRFSCGIFMGFLGTGTPKGVSAVGKREGARSGEEEALGGLRAWDFVVNAKNGTADFPGDGRQTVAFTDTRDVARFVEAALGMEVWPEELAMRGDLMDWRELVGIFERVQGRTFLVKENEVGEMERVAKEVEGKRFYNQVRIALVEGDGVVGDELNKAFPDIKPVGVEEFVRKWWEGVELGEAKWEEDRSFM